ncbi:50S ribosomal protein L18 [Afifella sp. H1R]|nr:50S ribosomal protein L18 [Afifella sp. H1R]MCT8265666.1 50S ribosomal protein L18 [Afifella sp. JA880]
MGTSTTRQRMRTERRKGRVRAALKRVAYGRPRLSVFRSSQHIYVQIIDDTQGRTLVSASTVEKDLRETLKSGANVQAASAVGKLLAERAKAAGIEKVQFDRGGYIYHGRIKALADAAREAGLDF